MDFDELLATTFGDFGPFQKISFCLLGLCAVFAAFDSMIIVFVQANPDYWCKVPSAYHLNLSEVIYKNLTHPVVVKDGAEVFTQCEVFDRDYTNWTVDDVQDDLVYGYQNNLSTMECTHGFVYDDSIYKSTMVTEWDLTCEEGAWVQATLTAMRMVGILFGISLAGNCADRFGRKPALAVIFIATTSTSIALAFVPNLLAAMIVRFIQAFTSAGVYSIGFVVVMEMIGPKWRMYCGIGFTYFYILGYLLTGVAAYFVRDWRKLQMVLGFPQLLLFIILIFVPESPRWLYSSKQPEKGRAVLEKIAKFNKVELPEEIKISDDHAGKAFVWDIFRTPRMRCRTFNICFNWAVNSMVYYGLSYNTSNIGGDHFVNFFIGGLVEIPAILFSQISLAYVGRRIPLAGTQIIAGLTLMATILVPHDLNWIAIALTMLGKMMITASFSIVYLFTAELYPTPVRSVGVTTGSMSARVGGIAAPYIGQLAFYNRIIPSMIFGSASLAAGLLALLLPETMGQNLPETLEDGENLGRRTKRIPNGKGEQAYDNTYLVKTSLTGTGTYKEVSTENGGDIAVLKTML